MPIAPDDLDELLAQPEGQCLAFLRERFKVPVLSETLVALANAQGGTVVIGVAGRGRSRVEGLSDVEAVREAVLEATVTCTPPLVLPMPEVVTHAEATLMLVTIPPGLPHVYSLHGKYLQRQGMTNQPMMAEALQRLLNDRGNVDWERQVPDNTTMAELDEGKIADYINRLGPAAGDTTSLLLRRGCTTRSTDDGTERPTHAGLLLFGRAIESRFPQAEITLVQYTGLEPSDEFERDDIRDTLPEAVRRAERWLLDHMRKGSRMVGLQREDWTQFPLAAVRETLVNAVAHRDYQIRGEGIRIAIFADRLECYSPGRLPGHVTLENLVAERFSRNETLVQVLADWGLIERLGYGIDRMIHQMAEANLPPPTFRETAAGFLVVLQGQPIAVTSSGPVDTSDWLRQGLNERQIAMLIHLQEHRRITNRDVQDMTPEVSPETIRRDLADLVERGLLLKVGERRATYYILK
ncbi:MAG: DeoR family transcriptional regulator [Chloroflexaceae bacterium]|nr:DeoR family transcriptional regulator [Chloroflexaceae bacterium]